MKNEIVNKLEVFDNVTFQEIGHKYFYKQEEIVDSISTTSLIGQFKNKFDAQGNAERIAVKENKTTQEVLDEWRLNSEYSCLKGNIIHEYSQTQWEEKTSTNTAKLNGIIYHTNNSDNERLRNDFEILKKQADQFYEDYKDKFELIKVEQLIYDHDYKVFGAIDFLFKNKQTGELVMVDIKSNKEIKTKGFKGQTMFVPLSHLQDCELSHYSMQLEIYKQILEKNAEVNVAESFILHFDVTKEEYTIFKPLDVNNEIKKILNLRKVNKNMAKMLMILGEGGTGKTTSLKKLPPKEHYYIDCDKKGLNYKGWKDDYNEANKNYSKTNDGEVVINLIKNISEKAGHIKYLTIDTINSIMIADEVRRSKQKGYDKWDDMANIIFNIVECVPDLREDLTVIFVGHTQTDEDGFVRLLTNGRKLNKIGLEKYFNTVLLAKCADGRYFFETRANNSTARTPFEAFDDLEIDNDITKVIEILKEY